MILAIVLISTLTLLSFSSIIFNCLKDKNNNLKVEAAYSFDNGTISAKQYKDNTTFTISTAQGLMNFAKTSYRVGYDVGHYEEMLFTGKTVRLTADIDMSGKTWRAIGGQIPLNSSGSWSFAGTFDGRGHTISNITSKFSSVYSSDKFNTGGLFYQIMGQSSSRDIVKDLDLIIHKFNVYRDKYESDYKKLCASYKRLCKKFEEGL